MRKAQSRKTTAPRLAKAAPPRRRLAGSTPRVCLGVLTGWDERGPLVDFEGNPRGPVRARVIGGGGRVGPGKEVVLLVSSGAPVLLGVLQPLDAELEARVDGRRVELEGRDEIVLRCGQASITLRRNGRVVIRGVQVETRASGINRIKGGSVSIN